MENLMKEATVDLQMLKVSALLRTILSFQDQNT